MITRPATRRKRGSAAGVIGALAGLAFVYATTCVALAVQAVPLVLEDFDRRDGLLTSEDATARDHRRSPVLEATSGSLYVRNGVGWSGVHPATAEAETSRRATLRARTRRSDLLDVEARVRYSVRRYVTTPQSPAHAWDGVHVLLRYRDQTSLYSFSLQRRDGRVAIKKKVPGGPSNGGTYHTLAWRRLPLTSAPGWRTANATAVNLGDGSVELTLRIGDRVVASAIDDGIGGPPITQPGRAVLRSDNCEVEFDDLAVRRSTW